MDKVFSVLQKKSSTILLITLVYLLVVAFLKWQIKPPMASVLFFIGGIVGTYFMEAAEVLVHLTPSPFRSIVFAIGFILVSFFVVTSSGSLLASGMVLTLYITLILWQIEEWRMQKNLDTWYQMIAGVVAPSYQRIVLIGFIAVFLVETYLFVR